MKDVKYCIINGYLFWKNTDGILLNYVDENETYRIITKFHGGFCGEQHYWRDSTDKVLRDGYYWSTLLIDVYKKVRAFIQH